MTEPIPSDVLDRLVQQWCGEETCEGATLVREWVAADPVRSDRVAELHHIWTAHRPLVGDIDVARALRRIQVGVEQRAQAVSTVPAGSVPSTPNHPTSRQARWTWNVRGRIAGWRTGVALTAGAVALVLGGTHIVSRFMPSAPTRAMTTYVTANGERARIELADGTVVMLNVASRLSVPADFAAGHRRLHLEGEAYFHVVHASGTPFVVDGGGVQSTVLGTEFGMRAYQPSDVHVTVRSGKVAVGDAVLAARDVAYAVAGGKVTVTHGQNVDAALAFTQGRLVLANVPLRDAIADLNRWYDVEIRVMEPTIGNERLEATLPSGSVGDLMEMLRATSDVRVVRTGRVVTVSR